MAVHPRAGTALVRPIKAAENFAGGKIVLLPTSVDALTVQQVELLAMGPVPERDEPEDDELTHDALLQTFQPNDWLVIEHRSWLESDHPNHYFIHQDAIWARLH